MKIVTAFDFGVAKMWQNIGREFECASSLQGKGKHPSFHCSYLTSKAAFTPEAYISRIQVSRTSNLYPNASAGYNLYPRATCIRCKRGIRCDRCRLLVVLTTMTNWWTDDDDDDDVSAVGCPDPSLGAGTLVRRDGDIATVTCNTSRAGGGDTLWTVRCIAGTWHGLASFNCSTGSDSRSSLVHTTPTDRSWTVGHFFPIDTFPYSQLSV